MRIPEVQLAMCRIATEHGIPELFDLAAELSRRKADRGAPTSLPWTHERKMLALAIKEANPEWSNLKIAKAVHVDAGRISELFKGYRK